MRYKKVQPNEVLLTALFKFFPVILLTLLLNSSNAQNLLSAPECASYDYARNRYLVSCYQTGNIVQIDSNGVQSNLITGFGHVLSNTISGNIFYFSVVNGLKGYDISVSPPQQVMNVIIPSSIQLDGMTTDTSGNLYVADFDFSGSNDKIFKINLTTFAWSVFVPPGHGLASPQDIEFDIENNRLIVANWFGNSPIQAVNLNDSTVTNIVEYSIGNFDGVAKDTSGNYYFTSWGTKKVHKYDNTFLNPPVIAASGFNGPSNLSYNPRGNLLVVPDFNLNSITFVPLSSSSVRKVNDIINNDFKLSQNYPNPFNPVTKIKFEIGKPGKVTFQVYDICGKIVETLVHEHLSAGIYETCWDGSKYAGGVYFYKLETHNIKETKKMLLIK